MTKIDRLDDAIPHADPTVTEIIKKSIAKVDDVIRIARSLAPIDKTTDEILQKNVPKQYAVLRTIIEAIELLQETVEDLDVLSAKRQESAGDLGTLTEKAISLGFVVKNLDHDIIIQYLLEERIKSGDIVAILAGLTPENRDKLSETLKKT